MKAIGICGNCEMHRTHGNPAFADFGHLASFVVNVSAGAISCRNQSKSNQIKPNPTKSNHYFFSGKTACRGCWHGVAGGVGSLFVFAVKNSCLQNFDSFFSDNPFKGLQSFQAG